MTDKLYKIAPKFCWDNCSSHNIILDGGVILSISNKQEAEAVVDYLNKSYSNSIDKITQQISINDRSLVELSEKISKLNGRSIWNRIHFNFSFFKKPIGE